MREHNHGLARHAAQALAERWRLAHTTPDTMLGCMVTLPLPERLGSGAADAARLKDWLLLERGIEVGVIARGARLWARLSMQVYNDAGDVERFAAAIDER